MYTAKFNVCYEIHTKHQRNVIAMYNFLMLNQLVSKVTGRL
jgi:hypothetical protein